MQKLESKYYPQLFTLLQLALELKDDLEFDSMDEEAWKCMFYIAQKNNITALLFDGILKLPEELRPPRKIWLRWAVEQEKSVAAYFRKCEVQKDLIAYFGKHDIPTHVLKGTTLSSCYPHPEYRSLGDIDIYQSGLQKESDALVERNLGISVSNDAHHHSKYVYKGVTVENHYDFVNTHTPKSNKEYEKILKALDPESPMFQALFLARHTAEHFVSSRITVRALCDWTMFQKTHREDVDWKKVWGILEQFNSHRFIGILQGIIEDEFQMPAIPSLSRYESRELQKRVLNDIINGEYETPDPGVASLKRMIWKVRRYNANRWKHSLVYSDSQASLIASSLVSHLQKPKSISNKM